MRTSDTIIEIAKAMNAAQIAMKPAIKDSTNPHFKSKYSDLASVMESIREPIGKAGLSVWQDATLDDQGVSVTTRIVHQSGEWVEFGPLTIPLGKKDAHGVGSAISYAKRYGLCAALGVVSDDDDGNAAVDSVAKKAVKDVPILKKISDAQVDELRDILQDCSPEYQKSVRQGLIQLGIKSFDNVTQDKFPEYKSKLLANRELYLKNKHMEEVES